MSSHIEESPAATPASAEVPSLGSYDGESTAEKGTLSSASNSVKSGERLVSADTEPSSPGDALLRLFRIRKRPAVDPDAIATRESVYDGPLAEFYQPIDKYENKAAFDPAFRWTHREEQKVLRKVDWKIFAWVLVMFLALDIDRGNLANATADNLLKDLHLTQADYNLGQTMARLGFLTAELPSQMVGKKIGVDRWLPIQMLIFSVFSGAQFWMKGRKSFLALRFLLSFFQGGFIPDQILYLSYYYTKSELPLRLSIFWTINYISDMITAFLAVGLLKMRGIGGYAGWRWMMLLEGLFTFVIGVASFFIMAPSPSQTKAPWRPKGYFNDHEVKIIVNRVVRDDPGKATMHNRQALTPKLLWKSLMDYDLWPLYILGLTFGIAAVPVKNYFQLSMKELGFSTVKANLLSIPNTAISVVMVVFITIASEVFDSRTWVAISENVWLFPFFVALRTLPSPINPWVYFAIATLLLGFPYAHPIQVAWCSRNSGSVRTRTVSASAYNIMVQITGIIGANIYQAKDAPRYYHGNSILLGIITMNIVVIYPGVYFYYKLRNAQREKIWGAMSEEEQRHYLATTEDEGNKRLDFRFAY